MYVCVVSTQILSSTTLFNINNNMYFEVLKDYVTLKTGVMAAGNSALRYIFKYIQTESSHFKW